jgi:hypothetical protein
MLELNIQEKLTIKTKKKKKGENMFLLLMKSDELIVVIRMKNILQVKKSVINKGFIGNLFHFFIFFIFFSSFSFSFY